MNLSSSLLFSVFLSYVPNASGDIGPRDEAYVFCGGGKGRCKRVSPGPRVDTFLANRDDDRYGIRCCRDQLSPQAPIFDLVPGKWPQRCDERPGVGNVTAESIFWDWTEFTFGADLDALVPQCWPEVSFNDARTTCMVHGARLCNGDELLDGCAKGTGCQLNRKYVWGCKEPWSPNVPPPAWDNTCETNADCCQGVCSTYDADILPLGRCIY